jgi:thiamine biosynthesis lipoprotein
VGYRNIELNAADRSVRFKQAGVELDPGGVGKGYAVDRMAAILGREGVRSALISGGGSSIFGLGTPPAEPRGWVIHIADPRNEKKTAADVFLKNGSLSTSGSYEKFFWADGKVYSHIMDPRTGYPAQGMLAVSVLAPRTLDSEVWAKPYFILGVDWTKRHKPADFRVLLCVDASSAPCAWAK